MLPFECILADRVLWMKMRQLLKNNELWCVGFESAMQSSCRNYFLGLQLPRQFFDN